MIFAVVVACAIAARFCIARARRAGVYHHPRALELAERLALPAPTTLNEAVRVGVADIVTGNCTRCGRYWLSHCRTGECGPLHVLDREVADYVGVEHDRMSELALRKQEPRVVHRVVNGRLDRHPVEMPVAGPGASRRG